MPINPKTPLFVCIVYDIDYYPPSVPYVHICLPPDIK